MRPVEEHWVDTNLQPYGSFGLAVGDIIEVVTRSAGVIDGTAMLALRAVHGADGSGGSYEAEFLGCLRPEHSGPLTWSFPSVGQGAVLHICAGGTSACRFHGGHRHIHHVDQFRPRNVPRITGPRFKQQSSASSGSRSKADGTVPDEEGRVASLERKLMEAKIKSGDASTSERLAYAAADHARKSGKKKKKKGKSKKDKKSGKSKKRGSSSGSSGSSSDSSSLF